MNLLDVDIKPQDYIKRTTRRMDGHDGVILEVVNNTCHKLQVIVKIVEEDDETGKKRTS